MHIANIKSSKMLIGIIGLGVTGCAYKQVFERYHDVVGYDKHKPSDSFEHILQTDISFIIVPTPEVKGRLDCSIVSSVLKKLKEANYNGVIVIKSTIGIKYLKEARKLFPKVVYNPEFLHSWRAIEDVENPPFLLFAGPTREVHTTRRVYYWLSNVKTFRVNDRTAEVTKLTLNAFAATKISFGNEIQRICNSIKDANPEIVMEILRSDPRCATEYSHLKGPYEGSCLPKDTKELMKASNQSILLKSVEEVNELVKKARVTQKHK